MLNISKLLETSVVNWLRLVLLMHMHTLRKRIKTYVQKKVRELKLE